MHWLQNYSKIMFYCVVVMCSLQVFDGSNSETRMFGPYCGTSAPKKVRSTSNVLLVTFFADGTINGNGFNINFSKTDGRISLLLPNLPNISS